MKTNQKTVNAMKSSYKKAMNRLDGKIINSYALFVSAFQTGYNFKNKEAKEQGEQVKKE